ncbi:hypothetical protein [Cytobacillus firmus]|uniref:Nucleoside-diphosphate sugar epimerase n=1 Tax=Cytobacillus firmus DS1 TaxID=1307436 RepID=W7L6P5_CYTFI|nr:hypothetical protein [Cytobacillus firmus]EWG11096.1 nucleoside-diphosphate sugar epimerase [Cytobacillus firmus DS1]
MRKKQIYWSLSFLFSFFGFYLIEHLFTVKPHVVSGNGNLGILVIFLFTPVFISSWIYTFKLAKVKMVKEGKTTIGILLFALAGCVLLLILINDYTSELITALGGTPDNPESKIYRFGWFNQYTNSLFFNVYTFFLSHVLIVISGSISVLRKI